MNEFEYNMREQAERRIQKSIATSEGQPFFVIKDYEVTSVWEPLQIEGSFIDGHYFYYRYRDGRIYMEVNRLPCLETTGEPIYSERMSAFFEMNDLSVENALNHVRRFWQRFDRTQNNEE